ncbi:MAG TPA: DNA polymerase II [Alphaproteobacteria bacterium]|nr:DNA polymerase II [Alphaproteobacteria bacterium]
MNDSKPMNGYVVYPTYRIIEDENKEKKAFVYLFGKLENGESFLAIKEYRPYFYIKNKDYKKDNPIDKAIRSFKAEIEDTKFKNFKDENVIKVYTELPGDVSKLRKKLEEEFGIEVYEADIRFYQRFLIDYDIKGSLEISGKYKKGNFVDRIYEDPIIQSSDWKPNLKVLSIDIETDQRAKQIYCVSLYTDDYKKVIIVGTDKDLGKPLHNAITVGSEQELIEKFQELVLKIDPDVITGWNLVDFDLKVLKQKFDQYKIPFTIGRIDWPCKIENNNDFMKDSTAEVPGRMVLDGIVLLKTSFIRLENYKLATAAEEFLGKKKIIGHENKGDEIENNYKYNQQKLIDYNLEDSQFVYEIIHKTGALQLTLLRSMITGMTLDRVKASVASLDSLFLRYSRKFGIVLNSSRFAEKDEPGRGGLVMDSKPGLYDNVLVLDFKSLYPSIIRTFNIDPYSFVEEKERPAHLDKDKYIKMANGAVFKNQEGILPKVITDVWRQRDEAKKRKDTPETIYALKIIMNSFYGVLSNPACRFYNLEMSNAITYTGQEIIKLTSKKVRELGYDVIYGDTDSIFVVSGTEDVEEAKKIGKKIQKHINDFYDEYIQKEYHRKNAMELQFEKLFKVFLMPTVRGSEEGAKKRYAGIIAKDDGKEELSFTGMEFVRGDWTDAAKKFQEELFNLVFHKKEVTEYIKKFVKDLKAGKYDDMLVYRKSISKSLKEYTKTTPPHVKAARMLDKLTSNIIQYVMTVEGPEPLEKLAHKPDYEHYIDKQLKPIADTILFVYGHNFDDMLAGTRQTSLFGF